MLTNLRTIKIYFNVAYSSPFLITLWQIFLYFIPFIGRFTFLCIPHFQENINFKKETILSFHFNCSIFRWTIFHIDDMFLQNIYNFHLLVYLFPVEWITRKKVYMSTYGRVVMELPVLGALIKFYCVKIATQHTHTHTVPWETALYFSARGLQCYTSSTI